jgi:hypothetical protein
MGAWEEEEGGGGSWWIDQTTGKKYLKYTKKSQNKPTLKKEHTTATEINKINRANRRTHCEIDTTSFFFTKATIRSPH